MKTVVLPSFSGKDRDYALWWPRFKAYAVVKKFNKALSSTTNELPIDPSVLSSDADTEKKQKRSMEENDLAVASFTMPFTTATLM